MNEREARAYLRVAKAEGRVHRCEYWEGAPEEGWPWYIKTPRALGRQWVRAVLVFPEIESDVVGPAHYLQAQEREALAERLHQIEAEKAS